MSESISNRTTDLDDLAARVNDALDLAIAGGAPLSLLEKLAASSGLLRALQELPRNALIPEVVARAHRALKAWQAWRDGAHPKNAA